MNKISNIVAVGSSNIINTEKKKDNNLGNFRVHKNNINKISLIISYMFFIFIILLITSENVQAAIEIPSAPVFSKAAGFYDSSFPLTITASSNATIYYTLDGSTPTTSSLVYSGPITIVNTTGNPNVISMINTTSPKWKPPIGLVEKSTVVRAIAVIGNQSSKVSTATYFLDSKFTVPVISISTDNANLFDYYTGIYTMGEAWDNASDWTGTDIFHPANYQNEGDDWEKVVHLEIFWHNGSKVVDQDVGARISGQGSRVRTQKSIKFYARADYGKNSITYPLFPQQKFTDYRRLWIRNGDDDLRAAYVRDSLAHKLVEGTPLAMEPYYPTVVFLNGEYWGFYPMRDRASQFYLASRYGVNKDNVIILNDNAVVDEGNPGDEQQYIDMVEFIRTHDMSDAANFDYVRTLMDTEDYARYIAINTFVVNTDWADRNLVYWKLRNGNLNSTFGKDGRWRWIMHDNDWSFGYQPNMGPQTNMYQFIHSKTWGSILWDQLSENEQFRDYYLALTADQLKTNFSTDNVISVLDSMASTIAPEIQDQINRWRHIPDVSKWEENIEGIRQFARDRPAIHRLHTVEYFGLAGTANLEVNKVGEGTIKINSLTPNNYPWSIIQFKDTPIEITATPMTGNKFVGWEGAASGNQQKIKIVLSKDETIRAVFAPIESNPSGLNGNDIWFSRKYPATNANVSLEDKFYANIENPQLHIMNIQWKVDNIVVSNTNQTTTNTSFDLSQLSTAKHVIELIVQADDTTIVQTWNVNLQSLSYTCYNDVQSLPVKCENSNLVSDTYNGCRVITCSNDGGSITATACNKPGDYNPSYYEMYKTSGSGIVPVVCLGATCLSSGYVHSNLPQCTVVENNQTGNQTNNNTGNNTDNNTTTYNNIQNIPATCIGGTITIDTFNGGREITCQNGTKIMKIQAWNKPDAGTPQYFEMYKVSETTNSNLKICLGTTCIADNGYAKSPNYPITITGTTTNNTGNNTNNNTNNNTGNNTNNQTNNNTGNTTTFLNVQYIPSTCTGGTLTKDIFMGGREITCQNGTKVMTIQAWDKPTFQSATYFEMYKIAQNGSGLKICLGSTCLSDNGYAKSPNYPIIVQTNTSQNNTNNNTGNNTNNQTSHTCYGSLIDLPANCTGSIMSDVNTGCRNIHCTARDGVVQVQACEKNDNSGKYFEMYRVYYEGTQPSVCLGNTCLLRGWGHMRSDYFPVCVNTTQQPICTPTTEVCDQKDNDCNGQIDELNVCGSNNQNNTGNNTANNTNNNTGNNTNNQTNNNTNNTQSLSVILESADWYPQENNQIWLCKASGGSGSYEYDFYLGDGDKLIGTTQDNIYHTYTNGTYTANCTVHDISLHEQASATETITI